MFHNVRQIFKLEVVSKENKSFYTRLLYKKISLFTLFGSSLLHRGVIVCDVAETNLVFDCRICLSDYIFILDFKLDFHTRYDLSTFIVKLDFVSYLIFKLVYLIKLSNMSVILDFYL